MRVGSFIIKLIFFFFFFKEEISSSLKRRAVWREIRTDGYQTERNPYILIQFVFPQMCAYIYYLPQLFYSVKRVMIQIMCLNVALMMRHVSVNYDPHTQQG